MNRALAQGGFIFGALCFALGAWSVTHIKHVPGQASGEIPTDLWISMGLLLFGAICALATATPAFGGRLARTPRILDPATVLDGAAVRNIPGLPLVYFRVPTGPAFFPFVILVVIPLTLLATAFSLLVIYTVVAFAYGGADAVTVTWEALWRWSPPLFVAAIVGGVIGLGQAAAALVQRSRRQQRSSDGDR